MVNIQEKGKGEKINNYLIIIISEIVLFNFTSRNRKQNARDLPV